MAVHDGPSRSFSLYRLRTFRRINGGGGVPGKIDAMPAIKSMATTHSAPLSMPPNVGIPAVIVAGAKVREVAGPAVVEVVRVERIAASTSTSPVR